MISKIYSKNEIPDEIEVVDVVKSVCQKYDIPAFTPEVVVERGAVPHSHPILTLNTSTKDERSILKTLVHEQLHWYAQNHPKYDECILYLKTKYEDDGEHNKSGSYPNSYWEHIIVCFNTRGYLINILPANDFEWVYEQWQPYPTLEKFIAENYENIKKDLEMFDIALFIKS